MLTLVIGNKNYSSWSLRPWLLMRVTAIPFEEVRVPLYQPGSRPAITEHSPSGKVPALKDGEIVVWDSLSICEYLAELHPEAGCWPADRRVRAVARSVSAEMHSGFTALRNALPMNCRRRKELASISAAVRTDIDRISALWRSCRERYGSTGEFLFGKFCIADAMYAPVVTRFTSYLIPTGVIETAYMTAVSELPAMQEWCDAAARESEAVEEIEAAT